MKKAKSFKPIALITVLLLMLSIFTTGCSEPVNNEVTKQENVQISKEALPSNEETTKKPEKPQVDLNRDAKSMNGMVAAATPEAAQVGLDILKKGGNAIDAAVATGFALGVLEPNASGIGGGGFMIIKFAKTGEEVFIDFRETASEKATTDMYELDENGKPVNHEYEIGPKSVAVPGEVAGLLTALEKYGTMDREVVLSPAIEYAEKGFEASEVLAGIVQKKFDVISQSDATSKIYLDGGLPIESGYKIVNPDLAGTLKIIAKEGQDGFYKGKIAQKIVDEIQNKVELLL